GRTEMFHLFNMLNHRRCPSTKILTFNSCSKIKFAWIFCCNVHCLCLEGGLLCLEKQQFTIM
ncbi:hypothetical protein MKX03_019223, partial [Papaver bracteatum]